MTAIMSDTVLGLDSNIFLHSSDDVEALVEMVDRVPVINLRNGVTIIEVPLEVVTEGLGTLLCDAAYIPFCFGPRAGDLEELDEGGAEVLPVVDGADRECF